jgi:DNA-directed RNA polymerase specialized sigma24 family protein
MAIPPEINEKRAKDASDKDAELALLVMAVPRLYASLTDAQARVLVARARMRGKSWPEVAAALGLSRNAATARWHRAMDRLPDVSSFDDLMKMNTRLWGVMS